MTYQRRLLNSGGADLGEIISDAFEKHLPDPSVLVEPAQVYAEKLTESALEKPTPLTNIVRDSVEGVAEARLSLQDQAEMIRSSMDGLSEELQRSLSDLELIPEKLSDKKTAVKTDAEQIDQLSAMVELRQSLDTLNSNLLASSLNDEFAGFGENEVNSGWHAIVVLAVI